jgi:hypothetical protein
MDGVDRRGGGRGGGEVSAEYCHGDGITLGQRMLSAHGQQCGMKQSRSSGRRTSR